MNAKVTFEEKRKIQLDMLEEVDIFCRLNDIRYSIAFGTLLGAVRHKGFIPWDDDVDIMMPLPDLLKFKKIFKSEQMNFIDVDIDKNHSYAFPRLAHKFTYNKEGKKLISYGVCIDVYVIIGLPKNSDCFFYNLTKLFKRRISMMKWRNRLISRLPITTIPFYSNIQIKYRDYLFENSIPYSDATNFYVIAGPLNIKDKMTYNEDLFRKMCELDFEGRKFSAIADWDYFLQLRYGDYMQLPPEEDRHPYHGGNIYWK